MKSKIIRSLLSALVICTFAMTGYSNEVLFETGFEADEGYQPNSNMRGVNGWVANFDGGTGIPDDIFFDGFGQQAFIGFAPFDGISETNFSLFLWHPIQFVPAASEKPTIEFSVDFQIYDSSTEARDDFRWSFFNADSERLFTLDFDNRNLRVNYLIGRNNEFFETRTTFDNDTIYSLNVTLDFESNTWTARLNDKVITANQALFEDQVTPSLGDVSAMWVVNDTANPGDNFMVFDNYKVVKVTESKSPPPVTVNIERSSAGELLLRARAEEASAWVIEGSDDLSQWNAILNVELGTEFSEWLLDDTQSSGFWRLVPAN